MFENISNSFKAKLYDFAYNPFISSFLTSWIVLNHKYLLIYFTNSDIQITLSLLSSHSIGFHNGFTLPISFGLFYTIIFPYATSYFYKITLIHNKNIKKIKQNIVDSTPLTQDESKELRDYNVKLITKNHELEKLISSFNAQNQNKENNLIDKHKKELKNLKEIYTDTEKYNIENNAKKIEKNTKTNKRTSEQWHELFVNEYINKNYKKALEHIKEASILNPKDYSIFNNWGIALSDLAKLENDKNLFEESFDKYKEANILNPKDYSIFNNWGNSLLGLAKLENDKKLFEESFDKLKKAIDLGGPSYNLACLYAVQNNQKDSLKYLEISLKNKEIEINFVLDDEDFSNIKNTKEFKNLLKKYE